MKTKHTAERKTLGFLTKEQAAYYLGISERTIDRHKEDGELTFHKVGGLIRFKISDLDEFPKRFEARPVPRNRQCTCGRHT